MTVRQFFVLPFSSVRQIVKLLAAINRNFLTEKFMHDDF